MSDFAGKADIRLLGLKRKFKKIPTLKAAL